MERVRPTVLRVIAHDAELSALMAAARWALKGAPGELPGDVREKLGQVPATYDDAVEHLNEPHRD